MWDEFRDGLLITVPDANRYGQGVTGAHRSRIRKRSRLRSNEPDYQANGHSNKTKGGHEQEHKEKYVAPGVVFMQRLMFLAHQQTVVSTIGFPGHVKHVAKYRN